MNWDLIIKLGIGLITLATAAIVAIHKIKEAKAQRAGLAANPERCLKHEERMSVIEQKALTAIEVSNVHFSGIREKLTDIDGNVKTLLNIHLKE